MKKMIICKKKTFFFFYRSNFICVSLKRNLNLNLTELNVSLWDFGRRPLDSAATFWIKFSDMLAWWLVLSVTNN